MPRKLDLNELDLLRLIHRSRSDAEGWRECTPFMFGQILELPDELVDTRTNNDFDFARLTPAGLAIVEWT